MRRIHVSRGRPNSERRLMRAAVFRGPTQPLVIEQVPDPVATGDRVVIEVQRAGICGSDLHMAEFGFAGEGTIFGHEFSGTVVGVGPDAARGAIGDRVTANPFDACRTCEYCETGHLSLCSGGRCIGTSTERLGAYAEYVAVPAHSLQRLPTGASFDEGALVEPLAVAYHAVGLANLTPYDTVLVMGGGPIGLAVTMFCRLQGVRALALSEPTSVRRAQATELGATAAIDPFGRVPLAEQVIAALGRPPTVVIECVGTAGRIQEAMSLVAPRGLVVIPGVCMSEDRIQPVVGIMKEVRLQFSATYTDREFAAVIDLIARREIQVTALRTSSVTLDQAPQAFRDLAADPRQIKVLIEPGSA